MHYQSNYPVAVIIVGRANVCTQPTDALIEDHLPCGWTQLDQEPHANVLTLELHLTNAQCMISSWELNV